MRDIKELVEKIASLRNQRTLLLVICLGLSGALVSQIVNNNAGNLRFEIKVLKRSIEHQENLMRMKDNAFLKLVDKLQSEKAK